MLLRARGVPDRAGHRRAVVGPGVGAPSAAPPASAVWDAEPVQPRSRNRFAAFVGPVSTASRFLGRAPPTTPCPSSFDREPRRPGGGDRVTLGAAGPRRGGAAAPRRWTGWTPTPVAPCSPGSDDDELYDGVVTVHDAGGVPAVRRGAAAAALRRRRCTWPRTRVGPPRRASWRRPRPSWPGRRSLEHRTGAWHRLLATSRALHAGVAHEDLRLPPRTAAGCSTPQRFPWLEGRTGADDPAASPPQVDDATVLRLLRAVQYVQAGSGSGGG